MIPQVLPTPDYLTATYRPDLDVLVVRWRRPTTLEELHEAYYLLLDSAAALPCPYWLLDVRGRDGSNKNNIQWMIDNFYPLLAQRFTRRVYLAYLFAPSHLRDLETAPNLLPPAYFDDKQYLLGRFSDEATALGWLRAQMAG